MIPPSFLYNIIYPSMTTGSLYIPPMCTCVCSGYWLNECIIYCVVVTLVFIPFFLIICTYLYNICIHDRRLYVLFVYLRISLYKIHNIWWLSVHESVNTRAKYPGENACVSVCVSEFFNGLPKTARIRDSSHPICKNHNNYSSNKKKNCCQYLVNDVYSNR